MFKQIILGLIFLLLTNINLKAKELGTNTSLESIAILDKSNPTTSPSPASEVQESITQTFKSEPYHEKISKILDDSNNDSALKGKFADWSIFTTKFGSKKLCYMLSLPIKKSGNYYHRGEPYFLVTNSDEDIDEITIASGYIYKEASEVELSFGLKKFNVFTYKSLAWASSKNDDIDIIKEMRRNLDIVISGTNKQNQYSSDTYSLVGFNQAYGRMKEICNTHNL